jgi:glycosyltransferase involved in cell wall biosynthesis
MKILVLESQWNQGFNGGYTSMLELCRAWPEGHELKILGKYFKPEVGLDGGGTLTEYSDNASLRAWITKDGWMPDIIWLNCLEELRLGDELSQTLDPGRKIALVANIRILKQTLKDAELNRLMRVDQLICASAYGAKVWVETYGFDVEIIPNAVNLRKFKPDPAAREKVRSKLKLAFGGQTDRLLLYIGRLEQCKGINDLPHVLKSAQANRPDLNYHLAIVGRKGHMPRDFKMQLSNLKSPNISIHGFSEHPEEWMQAADVLLVPSRWEELFGKVIVESMAVGLPVLATARGGIPEILTGELGRFLMEYPCHPPEWGRAIAELENENWVDRLRTAAQKFSAPKLAARYIEVFESVLRN